jgi:predicted LPLAT superfamily acyltransferase
MSSGQHAAAWLHQRERSNLAILRLMVWISLTLGRRVGRLVLYGIALYFLFFSPQARRASRNYLGRSLGRWAEWSDGYRHVLAFASTIHDRVYLLNDRFDLFDIEVHGSRSPACSAGQTAGRAADRRPPRQLRSPARGRPRQRRASRWRC